MQGRAKRTNESKQAEASEREPCEPETHVLKRRCRERLRKRARKTFERRAKSPQESERAGRGDSGERGLRARSGSCGAIRAHATSARSDPAATNGASGNARLPAVLP